MNAEHDRELSGYETEKARVCQATHPSSCSLTSPRLSTALGAGLSLRSLGSFPKLKVLFWFCFLRSIFNYMCTCESVWGCANMLPCVCRDQKSTLGPLELRVTASYEPPHVGAGSQASILCKCAKCSKPRCHFSSPAYSQELTPVFIVIILMCNNPNKTFRLFSAIFD